MTAETFFSTVRWAYRAAVLIVHGAIAYFVTKALSGDLEILLICSAGIIYGQVRFGAVSNTHGMALLGSCLDQESARIRGHIDHNTSERTKEGLREFRDVRDKEMQAFRGTSEKTAYAVLAEYLQWSTVQIVFAWPLAKLFWARLVA